MLFWRWEKSAIKPIYLNGQPWTRREFLIWLLVLIAMVVFGVLSVTAVLGPLGALVASVCVLGVVWMRYRAGVKLNAQRVERGADRSES